MADRRMFAKTIIDSDAFLDMPVSTQVLYFHLSMRADDEGFINSPKKIQRMIGCSDDDMKLLIAKSFVILFETGIIVIKHWKIHNYIRKDRINETIYKEERSSLFEKSNGAYTLKNPDENGIAAPCQPSVNHMSVTCQPSDSIGKVRLGKDSIGKVRLDILPGAETSAAEPETEQVIVIALPLLDKTEYPITENQIKGWCELYPAVDVMQEIRKMRGWLEANPKRGKTKAGILRFITGWLAKEQDKGGRYRNGKPESNQPQYGDPDYYKCDPGDSL
ncbi:replisome organizer [Acetobacterium wieringae]|uniref:replisome organizer n=1 Tax=Acetobacterium wieringae TaxID=52694 RepID=UPI00315971F3